MTELISVIVTTYNRVDALGAALRGLERQTDRNFEIIVADDGSTDATRDFVTRRAARHDLALKHVWQEDRGFRAAEIRNRGILASCGSYCIFLDGDCIPRPDFIAVHRRLAEPGWFVTGNRVLLARDLTDRILGDATEPERWGLATWIALRARRKINRLAPLLPLPAGALRKLRTGAWRGARSCNLAVWRSDLDWADGFDSTFSGWGLEDSDLLIAACRRAAWTEISRPACCISGIRRATARVCRRTSAGSMRSSGATASGRSQACRGSAPSRKPRRRRSGPAAVETMEASAITTWFARDRLARLADGLAVAVAVSLPWSTSATSILVGLWLLALLPTLDLAGLRPAVAHPAGGLPVALVALAVVGMLWADVPFAERFAALRGPHKLLMIPLLLIQFRRSDKGIRVIGGFLASCTVLLVLSWVIAMWPSLMIWQSRFSVYAWTGVPVKDYLVQSGEFLICAFALTYLAFDDWRDGRRGRAVAIAALALVFLANIVFVATGRSSLVVFVVLVLVIGLRRFDWKGRLGIIVGAAVIAAAAWTASPYLRGRVVAVADEITSYRTTGFASSTGFRLNSGRNRWNSSPLPRSSGTAPARSMNCSAAPRSATAGPRRRSPATRTI